MENENVVCARAKGGSDFSHLLSNMGWDLYTRFWKLTQISVLCTKIIRMTVTIETSGIQEIEQLLNLLKSLNIKNINIKEVSPKRQPIITKGDKKLDPRELFGIWQSNPRTLEQVRSTAWKRNWNIWVWYFATQISSSAPSMADKIRLTSWTKLDWMRSYCLLWPWWNFFRAWATMKN